MTKCFFLLIHLPRDGNDLCFGLLYLLCNDTLIAYEPDEWEIPRDKIVVGKRLGNGSFGRVFEGIVKDFVDGVAEVKCAVKMVNDYATPHDKLQFLKEATIMK